MLMLKSHCHVPCLLQYTQRFKVLVGPQTLIVPFPRHLPVRELVQDVYDRASRIQGLLRPETKVRCCMVDELNSPVVIVTVCLHLCP